MSMGDDLIRYDVLAQDAMRGVMRKVLAEVEKTGLPGEHHFFITFLTTAPGVRISSRLREKYPDQMTIVVQHQYWDLKVTETSFEIGLSFSDVPERLLVPFAAIKGFYDPSVNFELEFDVEIAGDMAPRAVPLAGPAPVMLRDVNEMQAEERAAAAQGDAQASADESGPTEESEEDGEPSGADVVSLDAFRKKT